MALSTSSSPSSYYDYGAAASVEEVAAWLESLASATSFSTESRLKVISMVDEAGQPCVELLMAEYLAAEARRAPGRFRQWQALMDFWEKLADAYQLIALQIEVSTRGELAEHACEFPARRFRPQEGIPRGVFLVGAHDVGGPGAQPVPFPGRPAQQFGDHGDRQRFGDGRDEVFVTHRPLKTA